MESKNFHVKFVYILFSFLPASIVLGSSISLANILLLSIIFIYIYSTNKNLYFQNHNIIKLLCILYGYLIINTFVGIDIENSLKRNFGFFRYILLFLAINYLFLQYKSKNKLFFWWSILIFIIIFDSYIQKFSGSNIFGWESNHGDRLVSFFKDEPIVGSYLSCFFLLISTYILKMNHKKYNKLFFFIFFITCLSIIFLSGERSNFLKIFFASILFFSLIKEFPLKHTLIFVILIFVTISIMLSTSDYLKHRYKDQIQSIFFGDPENEFGERYGKFNFSHNIYFQIYKSGYLVFKENKYFGVGSKNYGKYSAIRNSETRKIEPDKHYFISTNHPHQIYLEFLSEHGIIGTFIMLFIFFFLFFKMLKIIIINRNCIQIACFCYLITHFLPLIPSGSFFSDFNSNFFWINFSIFFAISNRTNAFIIK